MQALRDPFKASRLYIVLLIGLVNLESFQMETETREAIEIHFRSSNLFHRFIDIAYRLLALANFDLLLVTIRPIIVAIIMIALSLASTIAFIHLGYNTVVNPQTAATISFSVETPLQQSLYLRDSLLYTIFDCFLRQMHSNHTITAPVWHNLLVLTPFLSYYLWHFHRSI